MPTQLTHCDFDSQWEASAYLSEYLRVEDDERATMRFLAKAAARIGDVSTMLEFGCGPTVHHLFAFAPRVGEIHLTDYLGRNLDHVRDWAAGREEAHDWTAFVSYALQCELGRQPTARQIERRSALTRRRITAFQLVDARRRQPLLGIEHDRQYPAVLCCYCPDSITADIADWREYMANVLSLVAPRGWLVLTALRGAASYRVGGLDFPSAGVTEDEVATALTEGGFGQSAVHTADVSDHAGFGFSSLVFALGRKS